MAAAVVQAQSAATNASSPTSVTLPSTPTPGDSLLYLFDSDTTVTTAPSGATSRGHFVSNQESDLYTKLIGAGESSTQSITPNGAFPSAFSVLEISGLYDTISVVAQTQGAGQSSRSVNSVTPGSNGIAVAVAMLHGLPSGTPTGPAWTNGFTHYATVGPTTAASSATNVHMFIATKPVTAGTPVGATSVSWSNTVTNTAGWMITLSDLAGGSAATGMAVLVTNLVGVMAAAAGGGCTITANAAGAAAAPASGGASLVVNGSGTVAAPVTGGAQIVTNGSGVARAAATGAAQITTNASGTAQAPASGGSVLVVNGSGNTVGSSPATGTATLVTNAGGTVRASTSGGAILTTNAAGAASAGLTGTAVLMTNAQGVATGQAGAFGLAVLTCTAAAALGGRAGGLAVLNVTAGFVNRLPRWWRSGGQAWFPVRVVLGPDGPVSGETASLAVPAPVLTSESGFRSGGGQWFPVRVIEP